MLTRNRKARFRRAISRALHVARKLPESAQIEYHGRYSIHRLQALQEYIQHKFSAKNLTVLLCLTPCPSIAIITLMELIPLNAPSAGAHDNIGFWARFVIVNFILTTCFIVMAHLGVRMLNLTIWQGVLAVSLATGAVAATAYLCAIEIGFPVPFIMAITSLPSIGTMWTLMGIFSLRRILADPGATKSLKEWFVASGVVATQLFVYPLYNYAFRISSPLEQTALSLALGVVKIGYRLTIGNIIKQQADDKAFIVTFTANTFHAMFVAFSMQNATTIMTVVVLLLIDFLHSSAVIYDVYAMAQQLETLDHTIRVHEVATASTRCISVVDRAVDLISRKHVSDRPILHKHESPTDHCLSKCNQAPCRFKALARNVVRVRVSPSKQPKSPNSAPVSQAVIRPYSNIAVPIEPSKSFVKASNIVGMANGKSHATAAAETDYVVTTLRLLHLTEFSMLGELVEVVVPLIYSTFHYALPLLRNYFVILTIVRVIHSFVHYSDGQFAKSSLLRPTFQHQRQQYWLGGSQNAVVRSARTCFARWPGLDFAQASSLFTYSSACDGSRVSLGHCASWINYLGRVHCPRTPRALRSVNVAVINFVCI